MKSCKFKLIFLLFFCFTILPVHAEEIDRRKVGNLVIEGIPEIPDYVKERMLQYQNVRSAAVRDWLNDGNGLLISTRFSETNQLHKIMKPGGARQQITFFDEPISGAKMQPVKDKKALVFGKDVGGSEFYQLFYFDMETGKNKMLTDGKSRNGMALWNNKGDQFAFASTMRNGKDYDIYTMDPTTNESTKCILEKGGVWFPVDWSKDDSQLLVLNYISINESYYYILNIKSGNLEQINPSKEQISYGNAQWSQNSNGIYITSDKESEFTRLWYYDIAKKTLTNLTKDINWDIEGFEISPNGSLLAFVSNEDGNSKLYLLDTQTQKYKSIPGIPPCGMGGLIFDPSGKRLALTLNTAQTPSDVFVLDIETLEMEQWTFSEVGGLNTDTFVKPELIHYPTFDKVDGKQREIPAFFYKPENATGPLPVVIYIHGGPESQYTPYFSSTFQYWINELGVAIIAPNVRGSAGYGKSYLKLDNGFNREKSVQDIDSLLDWIENQPELDASRIAVYGGSYGGYMVLASMFQFNDRLKCGVDVVGISNFVTFLKNTQEYRRDLRRAEYGDERDKKMNEFLESISPTNHVEKIQKPLLVVQGFNDPRVPVTESEQMVEKIRENGGTVWYLMAKDEGHGFKKKSNSDYYRNSVILFLEQFLLK